MKLDHFRLAARHLAQDPVYSVIAIVGLSIGMAACFLLLGFVQYSWRYDSHVPNVDQVYVVKQRFNVDPVAPWFDAAPLMLRAAALDTPGVADATAFFNVDPHTVRIGGMLHRMPSLLVLPRLAEVLGIQAVAGDLAQALTRPEGLALTESTALRLFQSTRPLGRTLLVGDKTLRVAAIVRDPPANTTIPYESLYGVNSILTSPEMRSELQTGQNGAWGRVLLRLAPGSSAPAIEAALQRAVDQAPGVQGVPPEVRARLGQRNVMDLAIAPLREAYFDRDIARNPIATPGKRGDRATVAGLAAVAPLILLIGAINYVNLATLRVLRRQREIGVRKVMGARPGQLAMQFVTESVLVSMLATALGILIAWLTLPLFARLMDRQLDAVLAPSNLAVALLAGLALGLLASIQPVVTALRVRPLRALGDRVNQESATGARLRTVLTVLQIAIAVGLGGLAMGIALQTRFAMQASPGFDPAPLLVVDLPERGKKSVAVRGFISELSQQAGVGGIVLSEHVVGRFDNALIHELKREGGASVSIEAKLVDTNFFEVYDLRPVAGRLFDAGQDKENDPQPVVINAVAARELGFASAQSAVGQTLQRFAADGKLQPHRIVGIAPELRFRSLHEAPRATVYQLGTDWAGALSVRASGPVAQVEAAVARLWARHFPNAILRTQRAADILAANYDEDARLAKLLALATAIALALSAFGVYALSAHLVQRRGREIVLRKLHGAGRRQIAMLLGRDLGALIVVAALLGLPLAFVAMRRYQAGFVEHAPMVYAMPWVALAGVAIVTLLAATRHGWSALVMHPAQLLR
ncbi:MAG: ABC transporter permease [Pseudomonadota bacterium]